MSMSLVALTLLACSQSTVPVVVQWKELPTWPHASGRAGPAAGVDDGFLIVAGGANFPESPLWETNKVWHNDIHMLALPSGQWQQAESTLPNANAYGVSLTHPTLGVVLIGGSDGVNHFDDAMVLHHLGGDVSMTPLPSLPNSLAYAAGVLIDDTVWIVGGQPSADEPVASARLYSLDLVDPQHWIEHTSLRGPARILPVAGTAHGDLFVFSGCALVDGEREYLTDAWRYSPASGTWSQLADMAQPCAAAPTPAIPLGHDMLLMVGGDTGATAGQANTLKDDHPGFSTSQQMYCTTTDTWSSGGVFPRQGTASQGWPADSQWPTVTVPTVPWNGSILVPMGEMRPRVRATSIRMATPVVKSGALEVLDWVTIAVYLLALLGMGFFFSKREKGTDDFFLAGRRIPWWAAGISIFATQLSAITFMAIPAKAYDSDWVFFVQSLGIFLMAPLAAYLFLPFYRRLHITTAYEYLERRFSLSVRLLGSAQFILHQVGRVAVVVFLPALALSAVTGIDIVLCISVMGLLAIVYTVLGGIEVVIWSDVLQTVVLLGGALVAGWVLLEGVPGGWSTFFADASAQGKLNLVHPGFSIAEPVLYVVIMGAVFNNIIPYTADQAVVQRYLTTPDEKSARRAIWTGGLLAIPASVLFFGLGTLLWAFYRANPESLQPLTAIDQILPWFIVNELPAGVSGLIIAAIFAAAMSSIDSSMNSVSTAFTTDFYRRFRPDITDHAALRMARWVTAIFGVVGTAAAIFIATLDIQSVLDLWFKVLGLFASGLCGLFFLGILTRRPGTSAAIAGLVASAIVNFVIGTFTDINVLLIAAFGIGTCFATGVVVGIFAPSTKDLTGLTIGSKPPEETPRLLKR